MRRARPLARPLAVAVGCALAAGAATALPAAAQPSELFFSEYVEGSSNNKALEVYNGTAAPVDLAAGGYRVEIYFNGASAAGLTIGLDGTVAAGDVFVLAHSGATPAVLAQADQTNGASWFNGDDAIVLRKGDAVLDAIGRVGEDPGAQWGSGTASTADNTLRRQAGVEAGDSDPADPFDPAEQWDGFPTDSFDGLGAHPGTPPGQAPPPPPSGDCGQEATPISAVQGSGAASPLVGEQVSVEGVVTAVHPGLSGYYVQEEDADSDGDPATSEGVFVFAGRRAPIQVEEGQVVRVAATVGEYATDGTSQTQLASPTAQQVCGTAAEAVEPTPVSLPLETTDALERYEGMLVELVDELVISEYFNYDRFGEVVLAKPLDGQDRLYTPTAVVEPGQEAAELAAQYRLRRITLDDASSAQNPATVPHPGNGEPFGASNTFRGGDTVTGVQGVVDHTFGLYRVQPTAYGHYDRANPRPAGAPDVGGSVQVASFNVLNYFLTLDDGPAACGPTRSMDCRGANTRAELDRQRAKIVAALAELDADVVGLMEMENTPGVEPAADLAAGLNDVLGEGTYDYLDTGVVGTDAIRLGYLYKPGTVRPVGNVAVLDASVDPRFDDRRNRPMLTQTFDEAATGARFTVSVNHLKSKGSACDDGSTPEDGQGNCNVTRTRAAQAIADFLATDPTGSGDPDHLVIGDLNAYDEEDPIRALEAAGYTDLVQRFGGEYAYGYVFDGMAGYLDHALSNPALTGQVTGAGEWHVNADEPDALDYNLDFGRPAGWYSPRPYRSSDHDPVLVGLDLSAPAPERCYADGSQTVSAFEPGRRANGTAVPPPFSDPARALGMPDPGSAEPYWTALGLGGEIVLEFARPVLNTGGEDPDLRVQDTPDGGRGRADAALVLASADGEQWVALGRVAGTGELDLGPLAEARFVRVVDDTRSTAGRGRPGAVDGYDVDAVEVLSGCR